MTAHVDTGEPLPRALFDKMLAAEELPERLQPRCARSSSRCSTCGCMRLRPPRGRRRRTLLDEVRARSRCSIPPAFNRFPNSFSHIFAGGYAAGYYSYKWAEVLSADAYSLFEERGVLDPSTGQRFRDEILAVGGSRPALESFARSAAASRRIDALLRSRASAWCACTRRTARRPGATSTSTSCAGTTRSPGWLQRELEREPRLAVLGDLNVAPEDRDVHDPKRWEGQIHVSEPERAALRKVLALGLADAFRLFPAAGQGVLLVGLPPGRLPAQLGAAHRPHPARPRAGEALHGLHDRQGAAAPRAPFGPRAGRSPSSRDGTCPLDRAARLSSKWYERRLIEGHAWLVTALLCGILLALSLEVSTFKKSLARVGGNARRGVRRRPDRLAGVAPLPADPDRGRAPCRPVDLQALRQLWQRSA
jgi:hypothetical protein